MLKKKGLIISFVLLFAMIITGVILYSHLPDSMASSWDSHSQVDGFLPKLHVLLVFPIITLLFIIVQTVLPYSLLKREKARDLDSLLGYLFNLIIAMITGYFVFVVVWNMGYTYDVYKVVPLLMAMIFYFFGIIASKLEPKIDKKLLAKLHPRDIVSMQKTNGNAFKIGGIILLLSVFFKPYTFYFVLAGGLGVLIVVLIKTVITYSKARK